MVLNRKVSRVSSFAMADLRKSYVMYSFPLVETVTASFSCKTSIKLKTNDIAVLHVKYMVLQFRLLGASTLQ